jgi:flagellar biosynthetic protein FliP
MHSGKIFRGFAVGLAALFVLSAPASAQTFSLDLGTSGGTTERALQLIALLTVLSIAPAILITLTSFTRIVVVLSLLRSAIGVQSAPPNTVIVSLALFLTAFVMAPTGKQVYTEALAPLIAGTMQPAAAFDRGMAPMRTFMLKHVREKDLALFIEISGEKVIPDATATPIESLIPAFMISELRRAFEIGFLLFMPFLIIDLVVASILMSVGMMMLPPTSVSLPFKLIFFVLVDGWHLIADSLVQSFGQ